MKQFRLHALVACLFQFACWSASAQQGGERPFTPPPEPQVSAPIVVPEGPAAGGAPSGATQYRFVLRGLALLGGSALPASELLAPYLPLVGTEVGVDRIYEIAAELTARYRHAGYLLSVVNVPPQTITDGQVTLRVTEGFIDDVAFEGDTSQRPGYFDAVKARLLASKPLSLGAVERALLLMNDLPGVSAQATLAPSVATPGASRLVIRVTQDRFAFNAGANNRGSESLGPLQGDIGIEANSLLGMFDRTSVRYVSTGSNKELSFASLSHSQLLSSRGWVLTASASRSESKPPLQNALPQLAIETDSTQYRLEITYPAIRSRRLNLALRGSLTHHDGRTEFPFFGVDLARDKLSAVRLGATLDFVDGWRGVNILDLEASRGLDGLGASELGALDASRLGGRPDFTKVNLYAARLQSLAPRWSLLVAVSGQFAMSNLLSSEEFAFGGEYFGRAYDASELVGDSGVAGKLELRFTQQFGQDWLLTVYGFGETGRVYRRLSSDEIVGEEDGASSAGLGLRFDATERVSGYIEYAKPLDQIVLARGDDDARVFGGIRIKF